MSRGVDMVTMTLKPDCLARVFAQESYLFLKHAEWFDLNAVVQFKASFPYFIPIDLSLHLYLFSTFFFYLFKSLTVYLFIPFPPLISLSPSPSPAVK